VASREAGSKVGSEASREASSIAVIAGELEGSRRDCNIIEKQ
jgi:hypothetical protein